MFSDIAASAWTVRLRHFPDALEAVRVSGIGRAFSDTTPEPDGPSSIGAGGASLQVRGRWFRAHTNVCGRLILDRS